AAWRALSRGSHDLRMTRVTGDGRRARLRNPPPYWRVVTPASLGLRRSTKWLHKMPIQVAPSTGRFHVLKYMYTRVFARFLDRAGDVPRALICGESTCR